MLHWVSVVGLLLAGANPPPGGSATSLDVVSALESALGDAIAKAEPSVVAIAREKSEDGTTTAVRGKNEAPPGERMLADQLSFDYGSGVVIGGKGEILTTFHVVRGARRLLVRAAGKQEFDAEVIAADPRSDLAVIVPREIPGIPVPNLTPIVIGDATNLRKGTFLIALGNSFNAAAQDGRPSASWGILANVARRIEPAEDRAHLTLKNYPTLLQLDAKLNIGMSGGAVINVRGELIGLTNGSANAVGFDAQAGYAIPMDAMGKRAVDSLRQGKEVEYGFLGIQLDLDGGSSKVRSAQPGTPAAEGEVQQDDLVLGVGDTPVHDMDSLILAINAVPAGARVILKLRRRNELLERPVDLAKLRIDGEVIATNRPPNWRGLRVDYMSTLPNTNFGAELLSAMAGGGVAVVEVQGGSPADKAGLKPGQVIKSIDGQPVRNPRDFAKNIANRSGTVTFTTDVGPITVK